MSQNIKIEDMTRKQIAEFLPVAIELAVKSYRKFMSTEEDLDKDANIVERDFVEHHKAAKIAISHIELLIKLAKWADLPDSKVASNTDALYLQRLMKSAEAEIEAYEETDGEEAT